MRFFFPVARNRGAGPSRRCQGRQGGVAGQIEPSLKSLAIENEKVPMDADKNLEESEMPKKVGTKLKRSAESLGLKVEEAEGTAKKAFMSE
jgi:hypothetical protein